MRKLKKGIKIILIVIASAIVLATLLFLFRLVENMLFENKTTFSVKDVEYSVNKIYRETMGFSSNVSVHFSNEKKKFKSVPHYDEKISIMEGDQFIVDSYGGDGIFSNHTEPTEIAAAFDCILFFEGKDMPGTLLGISNDQKIGGIDNYHENMTFFTPADVQELCKIVDVTGLSRRDAARKLAAAWIEQTGYVKR